MGKGDTYRPVNKKKYDENFDKIRGGIKMFKTTKIGTKKKVICPACDGKKVNEKGKKCSDCKGQGVLQGKVVSNV